LPVNSRLFARPPLRLTYRILSEFSPGVKVASVRSFAEGQI
jgi:hypothetical protein